MTTLQTCARLGARMVRFVRVAAQRDSKTDDVLAVEHSMALGIATGIAESIATMLLPDDAEVRPAHTAALVTWASEMLDRIDVDVERLTPRQVRMMRVALSIAVSGRNGG